MPTKQECFDQFGLVLREIVFPRLEAEQQHDEAPNGAPADATKLEAP